MISAKAYISLFDNAGLAVSNVRARSGMFPQATLKRPSANPRVLSGEDEGDATFLKRKSNGGVTSALTEPNLIHCVESGVAS